MTTPLEKGDHLEAAVAIIEGAILKGAPGYAEDRMRIERKKFVTVSGVRHEIDVFVTVIAAAGYEAIFIFECKNWKDPVDKNQIIIFSEKIHAVHAQRGFFVVRRFSKDAIAQSKKDSRIELLRFSEDFILPTFIEAFHTVEKKHRKSDIELIEKNSNRDLNERKKVDMDDAVCIFNGESASLRNIAKLFTNKTSSAKLNKTNTVALNEGTHRFTAKREFDCNGEYKYSLEVKWYRNW